MGTKKSSVAKKTNNSLIVKFYTIICLVCLQQGVRASSLNVNQSTLMSPFEIESKSVLEDKPPASSIKVGDYKQSDFIIN